MTKSIFKLSLLTVAAILVTASSAYAGGSGGGESSGGKEYVQLEPLVLPAIDNDGVYQVISFVISLEVETISEADKIKLMKPKIADAYIQNMYGMMNAHEGLKDGIVQVALVKNKLKKITDKVLGEEIHAEVLLQTIQQRPI